MKQVADKVVVHNWRDVLKRYSFWLGIAGTAVTGFAVYAPEIMLQAWLAFPADLKQALPPNFAKYFGLFLFAASNVAMFIKQRRAPK